LEFQHLLVDEVRLVVNDNIRIRRTLIAAASHRGGHALGRDLDITEAAVDFTADHMAAIAAHQLEAHSL